ncbi:STAS domain-containing protein [Frateuria defendens]|uniref:STAS domain-containing protein n=1 Tax=Frateuria defendens TaxID=2219559 RepID=UPI00066FCE98|nr:STAS domain-containing protein [Frateuria defendens]
MSDAGFTLERGVDGTLAVGGELTFATAAAALQAILDALAAQPPVGRLDLGGVVRSDSAGLACVLAAQAQSARQGRALTLDNVPAGMRALAQVCEVDELAGAG